jgi:hypothetical protein
LSRASAGQKLSSGSVARESSFRRDKPDGDVPENLAAHARPLVFTNCCIVSILSIMAEAPHSPRWYRFVLLTTLLAALLGALGYAVHHLKSALGEDLIQQSNVNLPTGSGELMEKALWRIGKGTPPTRRTFAPVHANDWKDGFRQRRQAMIEEAQSLGLDCQSLDDCLGKVLEHSQLNGGLVYVPDRVYRARQGTNSAWVIAVGWEIKRWVDSGGIGHIRYFAFDATSRELIGFVTCD